MTKENFKYFVLFFLVFVAVSCNRRHRSSDFNSFSSKRDNERAVNLKNESKLKENALDSRSTQKVNHAIPTLNQLFTQYKPAVFMVFTSDGEKDFQGSGFFVSADGIAISNYHVFKGTYKGLEAIKTFDDKILNIEKVLFQSEEDDYIIFKVRLNDNDRVKYISIAEQIPEIGEDVFAIGNPLGLEHTLSKGIISGYRDNQKLIQTTTEITHGSSGGPLINMKGEVVGITTSGAGEANINFAVNIKKLNLYKYL